QTPKCSLLVPAESLIASHGGGSLMCVMIPLTAGRRRTGGRYMIDSTDWHKVLSRVAGGFVRGGQRVASHELVTKLGVPGTDPGWRRLKRVMRDLGWRGPKLMRWGDKTLHGYWRHPTVGLPEIVSEPAVDEDAWVNGSDAELPRQLERVTRLGLEKTEQILKIP